MRFLNLKCVRFFLSGIFALMVFVSLQAAEAKENGLIYKNEDAQIAGKEYIYINSAPTDDNTLQVQDTKPELETRESHVLLDGSPNNCIVENTKKRTKTEDKAVVAANNDSGSTEIGKNPVIVLPDFPFLPSSSSYLYVEKKSAAVSHHRINKYQLLCKAYRGNNFQNIKNQKNLSFVPDQRQKLSITATQCGILTSFSPNSPTSV